MFNLDHPFFRPLWKRIATVFVCFAWAVVEYMNGNPLWGMFFLGLGAFVFFQFFLKNNTFK